MIAFILNKLSSNVISLSHDNVNNIATYGYNNISHFLVIFCEQESGALIISLINFSKSFDSIFRLHL